MRLILTFRNQASSLNFDTHKRQLQRIRSDLLPPSPKTLDEVKAIFENESNMRNFGFTLHEDPNIFYKVTFISKDFAYCIFGSDIIMNLIETHISPSRRHYLMDATFKICPVGDFNQLLIVYVEYMDKVLCVLYGLLSLID